MKCSCGQPVAYGRNGNCEACYARAWRASSITKQEPGFVRPRPDRHRYPFSALDRLLPEQPVRNQFTDREGYWEGVLGVAAQQVDKWRKRGLSWRTADKLACRLGTHPGLVWSDWFERGYMDGRMDQEESAA